jgi:hypothetical protein
MAVGERTIPSQLEPCHECAREAAPNLAFKGSARRGRVALLRDEGTAKQRRKRRMDVAMATPPLP